VDPPVDRSRGWQPDPADGSQLRYWTGQSWSDKTRRWSATESTRPSDVAVRPKRFWPVLLGALVVLALFFVHPALGLGALVLLLLLAVLFAITRPGSRPCPRCGQRVTNGVLDCPHCAFDFRTVGA